jgi:cell division protein ZapA
MTQMDSPKNSVRVNIYGEEYAVRADGGAEYIREVAGYVDRKMREIGDTTNSKSPMKVSILAALNITDELFQERSSQTSQIDNFEDRTRAMLSLLEEALPETAP